MPEPTWTVKLLQEVGRGGVTAHEASKHRQKSGYGASRTRTGDLLGAIQALYRTTTLHCGTLRASAWSAATSPTTFSGTFCRESRDNVVNRDIAARAGGGVCRVAAHRGVRHLRGDGGYELPGVALFAVVN
jgi:hypothetical protein